MTLHDILSRVDVNLSKADYMQILIGYCSSQGQTRKIARYALSYLAKNGHCVELLELKSDDELDFTPYDKVILAASIHIGHYQKSMTNFVIAHANKLQRIPTMFLSVSLAAAGHVAEDWRTLDKIAEEFVDATQWQPNRVGHIAGAYLPSKYDLFTKFIMRRIVAKQDPRRNLDEDHEYTDWDSLETLLGEWLSSNT